MEKLKCGIFVYLCACFMLIRTGSDGISVGVLKTVTRASRPATQYVQWLLYGRRLLREMEGSATGADKQRQGRLDDNCCTQTATYAGHGWHFTRKTA